MKKPIFIFVVLFLAPWFVGFKGSMPAIVNEYRFSGSVYSESNQTVTGLAIFPQYYFDSTFGYSVTDSIRAITDNDGRFVVRDTDYPDIYSIKFARLATVVAADTFYSKPIFLLLASSHTEIPGQSPSCRTEPDQTPTIEIYSFSNQNIIIP